jgi:type I restriction enzyme S subunit
MLTSENILQQVAASKIGGAVPTLTETKIKEFNISTPPQVEEKHRIGTFFANLDALITLHQRKPKFLIWRYYRC